MDAIIRGFRALLAKLPYLVPAFTFFSPILYSIGLFCPNLSTRTEASQIIIAPSTRLQYPNQNVARPDGPTVWFGIFGSCARVSKDMKINCTPLRYNSYDFSVLPSTAPVYVLQGPPLGSVVVGYIVLGIWPCLFGICSLVYIRAGLGCRKGWIEDNVLFSGLLPWVASLNCVLGGINFWILKLYFDWTCDNFNDFVARQGPDGPKLIASRGHGVDFAEDSFMVFFVPWVIMMLHVFKQLENPPENPPEDKANTGPGDGDDGTKAEKAKNTGPGEGDDGTKAEKAKKDKKDGEETDERKDKEAKKADKARRRSSPTAPSWSQHSSPYNPPFWTQPGSPFNPFPPGFSQPGFSQPGFSQPGFFQPGFSQPGSPFNPFPPGFSQPGFSQPGFFQPGFSQPGFSFDPPPSFSFNRQRRSPFPPGRPGFTPSPSRRPSFPSKPVIPPSKPRNRSPVYPSSDHQIQYELANPFQVTRVGGSSNAT